MKESLPVGMPQEGTRLPVNVTFSHLDDHFLVNASVMNGRIICHTLSEALKRLKPILEKAFPKTPKPAEKPKKAPAAAPEKTGLPRTPFKDRDGLTQFPGTDDN